MGITGIKWTPLEKGGYLEHSSKHVWRVLVDTFGDSPIRLGFEHTEQLEAMTKASGDEAYQEIANIIEQHGDILLEAW